MGRIILTQDERTAICAEFPIMDRREMDAKLVCADGEAVVTATANGGSEVVIRMGIAPEGDPTRGYSYVDLPPILFDNKDRYIGLSGQPRVSFIENAGSPDQSLMGVEPYPIVTCGDKPGSPKANCDGTNPAHTYGRKIADLKLYGDPVKIAEYVRQQLLPPRIDSTKEEAKTEIGKPYKRTVELQSTVRIHAFWVVIHETETEAGKTTGRIIARGRNFDEKNPKPSMEIPIEFTPTEAGRYRIAVYELRGSPAEGINDFVPFHVESVEVAAAKTEGGAKPARTTVTAAPPPKTVPSTKAKEPVRAKVKSITGDVGEIIITSERGGGMYIKVTDPKGKVYEANVTLEEDGSTIVRIIPSLESIVEGTYDENVAWIVKPEKKKHPESGTWRIEFMERVDGALPPDAKTTQTFGIPKEPRRSRKTDHRGETRSSTTRRRPKAALPDIGNL